MTPVEVGYYDPYIPELFWVNRFIDAVFWADLLLQFCIEVRSSQAGSPIGSIRLAFGFSTPNSAIEIHDYYRMYYFPTSFEICKIATSAVDYYDSSIGKISRLLPGFCTIHAS